MDLRVVVVLAATTFVSIYLGVVATDSGNISPTNSGNYCTTILYCKTCANPRICTECNEKLWFLDNTVDPPVCLNCSATLPGCLACNSRERCNLCINPGSNGPDLDSSIGTCSPCAAKCKFCNASGSGKCDMCTFGYFVNAAQQCQECDFRCMACKNETYCYTCESGYYRLSNVTCSSCAVQNCATCRSDGSCIKCKSGTPTNNGTSCFATEVGN